MRTIGYARVSTDKQSVSLEAQKKKIEAMATVKDVQVSEIIADMAESAASLERPGMERLLAMVNARQIDCVVVCKLDRITRSVKDLADLLALFSKKGVSLVSIEESLDTNSAAGRLVLNIMVSVSQWEREAIGERTKTALGHIKAQGFPAGSAPYGFKSQPRTAEEKRLKIRKVLVEEKNEQEIIAHIERMRRNDLFTYQGIANWLNDNGYKTRSGGPWVFQTVQRKYAEAKAVA